MIYEPTEDSFLLEKYVKVYAEGKVLDLGCGSGIQALAALEKTKYVSAADINPDAVSYCKNRGINSFQSDLFSNIKEKFDMIIFNPPYLPEDKNEDGESSLITSGGAEGIEILGEFFDEVKNYLNYKGKVLFVCSSLTGDVESLMLNKGFKFKLLETKKLFFEVLKVYLAFAVN